MTLTAVLVVDDNVALRDAICENLELDGYTAVGAASGAEALVLLRERGVSTILLDLMLPDADGLTLIGRIRAVTDAPIIIISGKSAWVDKVVGLEMGADDYLAKPFEMKELSARVKAAIRRSNTKPLAEAQPARRRFGSHILDPAKYQAFDAGGNSCDLTPMEFRLLEALVEAPNRVLSREQLLERAREGLVESSDRAIDIQIARIRRKLGDADLIQTVRGIGYVLSCDVGPA